MFLGDDRDLPVSESISSFVGRSVGNQLLSQTVQNINDRFFVVDLDYFDEKEHTYAFVIVYKNIDQIF